MYIDFSIFTVQTVIKRKKIVKNKTNCKTMAETCRCLFKNVNNHKDYETQLEALWAFSVGNVFLKINTMTYFAYFSGFLTIFPSPPKIYKYREVKDLL